MRTLALFDFDGTITSEDTFISFVKFYHGTPKFVAGFIFFSPILVLMKLGLIDNGLVKNMVFSYFFKGVDEVTFNKLCANYCNSILPNIIRPKAIKKIESHLSNKDRTIIVSASPENWIIPWASTYDIQVISTLVEVRDGVLTGQLASKNCHGPEKVERIKKEVDLDQFDKLVAYGDTSGDREMLDLADESHYKPFQ